MYLTFSGCQLFANSLPCGVSLTLRPIYTRETFMPSCFLICSAVIVPVGTGLRLYDRGGVLQADIPAAAFERPSGVPVEDAGSVLTSLAIDSYDQSGGLSTGRLLAAGRMPAVHLLDATRLTSPAAHHHGHGHGPLHGGKAIRNAVRSINMMPVNHSVSSLCSAEGRVLVAASGDGPDITLFDGSLRAQAPVGRLASHAGGTVCVDATRHYIITCGNLTPGESGPSLGARQPGIPVLRAQCDPVIRIFDVRMQRQFNAITVPSVGKGGGPIFVKFLPEPEGTLFHDALPTLLVGTSDGRLFTCEPQNDRLLSLFSVLDPQIASMHRSNLRGESYVPTPDNSRLRIASWSLSPSGSASAAADHEGFVHIMAPVPLNGIRTSKFGILSDAPIVYHGSEPWIHPDGAAKRAAAAVETARMQREQLQQDAGSGADDGTGDPQQQTGADGTVVASSAREFVPKSTSIDAGDGSNRPDGAGDEEPVRVPESSIDWDQSIDSTARLPPPTPEEAAARATEAAVAQAQALKVAQAAAAQGSTSFSAAVLAKAMANANAAMNTAQAAANAAAAAETLNMREPILGTAGTIGEALTDGLYDAVLMHGVGSDVPVAAPGISSLGQLTLLSSGQQWSGLWSVGIDAVKDSGTASYWGHEGDPDAENAPAFAAGGKKGFGSPGRTKALAHQQRQHLKHDGYIPARDRVSTFPDWANDVVMAPQRRRDADPALLGLTDRSGNYINNRPTHLRLKPNALLYGKRRGYVDLDPRKRDGARSTFVAGSTRERGNSVDSDASSTGSSIDLERLMRGDKDWDRPGSRGATDDEDEEDEADDGIETSSVGTESSLMAAHAASKAAAATAAASASNGPKPLVAAAGAAAVAPAGRLRVHIPRAYRRPKLTATRFGFFDFSFDAYNHSPFPFAGFEEVGPNSFVNAVLQMLFFARGLRRRIQRHLCSAPHCLACELRFVFDVACQAPLMPPDSRVATAQNLIRVLQFVTEIKRLGLLHPCGMDPSRRIGVFVQKVLDRVSKEVTTGSAGGATGIGSSGSGGSGNVPGMPNSDFTIPLPIEDVDDTAVIAAAAGSNEGSGSARGYRNRGGRQANPAASVNPALLPSSYVAPQPPQDSEPLENLFNLKITNVTICSAGHSTSRDLSTTIVEMAYPPNLSAADVAKHSAAAAGTAGDASTSAGPLSFTNILTSSFSRPSRTKAWCDGCKAYVSQTQVKVCAGAGPLLMVSTNAGPGVDGPAGMAAPASATGTAPAANAAAAAIRQLWSLGAGSGSSKPWVASRIGLKTENAPVPGASNLVSPRLVVSDLSPGASGSGSTAAGPGVEQYELVGVIVHIDPELAGAPSSSKAKRRSKRTAASIVAAAVGGASAASAAGGIGLGPSSSSSSQTPQDDAEAISKYHYVSCLKVHAGGAYAAGAPSLAAAEAGDDGGRWLIFNDFRITPSTLSEVLDFTAAWKTPSVLLYQKVGHEAGSPPALFKQPAFVSSPQYTPGTALSAAEAGAASAFAKARRAQGYIYPSTVQAPPGGQLIGYNPPWPLPVHPLMADLSRVPHSVYAIPPSIPHQTITGHATTTIIPVSQIPKDGGLVAIDSEFVAVATERSRTLPDGSRRVLAQARLMPGRVSVIREDASVIIDAYVAATEPVVDHLTRFSGLHVDDLDPNKSAHRLHTYKDVYMKMRSLVDAGAIFVGHGLRKDCRELGLFVPLPQILDTVKLYKLEGQRYLSLKFLSSHVLSADIQGSVHDSTEDAYFALALYKHYRAILEGRQSAALADQAPAPGAANAPTSGPDAFERLLHHLYDIGRSSGWRAKARSETTAAAGPVLTASAAASMSSAGTVGAGGSQAGMPPRHSPSPRHTAGLRASPLQAPAAMQQQQQQQGVFGSSAQGGSSAFAGIRGVGQGQPAPTQPVASVPSRAGSSQLQQMQQAPVRATASSQDIRGAASTAPQPAMAGGHGPSGGMQRLAAAAVTSAVSGQSMGPRSVGALLPGQGQGQRQPSLYTSASGVPASSGTSAFQAPHGQDSRSAATSGYGHGMPAPAAIRPAVTSVGTTGASAMAVASSSSSYAGYVPKGTSTAGRSSAVPQQQQQQQLQQSQQGYGAPPPPAAAVGPGMHGQQQQMYAQQQYNPYQSQQQAQGPSRSGYPAQPQQAQAKYQPQQQQPQYRAQGHGYDARSDGYGTLSTPAQPPVPPSSSAATTTAAGTAFGGGRYGGSAYGGAQQPPMPASSSSQPPSSGNSPGRYVPPGPASGMVSSTRIGIVSGGSSSQPQGMQAGGIGASSAAAGAVRDFSILRTGTSGAGGMSGSGDYRAPINAAPSGIGGGYGAAGLRSGLAAGTTMGSAAGASGMGPASSSSVTSRYGPGSGAPSMAAAASQQRYGFGSQMQPPMPPAQPQQQPSMPGGLNAGMGGYGAMPLPIRSGLGMGALASHSHAHGHGGHSSGAAGHGGRRPGPGGGSAGGGRY